MLVRTLTPRAFPRGTRGRGAAATPVCKERIGYLSRAVLVARLPMPARTNRDEIGALLEG